MSEIDELEAKLRRRDPRFLIRLVLALAVTLLAGLWGFLLLMEADLGSCAARSFETITAPGEPSGDPR